MDATLGRKVLGHVTAHREQFDPEAWDGAGRDGREAAGLGARALLLSGYALNRYGGFTRPDGTPVRHKEEEAARLLGLAEDERWGGPCPVLLDPDAERAIGRFRSLAEAAEAAGKESPSAQA